MVFRVNKTKDYTVMSNYCFSDNRLSLKAKGLLAEMLSLPTDWDYSIEGLVKINKESKTAIVNTLGELKECGYLAITKLMPNETESGRFEYTYDIYEYPQDTEKQDLENQALENQGIEIQDIENVPQINTNKQNTKKQSTKDKVLTKRFVKPTLEEVKAYCLERGETVDPVRWYNYYEANGWKVGRNPMKDWRAAVRTWERGDKKKPKQQSFEEMFSDYTGNS